MYILQSGQILEWDMYVILILWEIIVAPDAGSGGSSSLWLTGTRLHWCAVAMQSTHYVYVYVPMEIGIQSECIKHSDHRIGLVQ